MIFIPIVSFFNDSVCYKSSSISYNYRFLVLNTFTIDNTAWEAKSSLKNKQLWHYESGPGWCHLSSLSTNWFPFWLSAKYCHQKWMIIVLGCLMYYYWWFFFFFFFLCGVNWMILHYHLRNSQRMSWLTNPWEHELKLRWLTDKVT